MRWFLARRRSVEVLATAAFVIVLYGMSFGATYYVSPTGSASNPGTPGEPWSLAKANSDLMPGDTAVLLDGSYASSISPSRNGTAGAPITYRSANLHQATFSNFSGNAVYIPNRSYIVIDGIESENVSRWILAENWPHHISVLNCNFRNASSYQGVRFRPSGDGMHVAGCSFEGGEDQLTIEGGDFHLIEDNYIGQDGHSSVLMRGIKRSVFRRNYLTNPTQRTAELYSTAAKNYPDPQRTSEYVLVEDNVFDTTGYDHYAGIQFASVNCILRRNIFTKLGCGMDWTGYYESTGQSPDEALWNQHNRFYNNVVYSCGYPASRNFSGSGIVFSSGIPDANWIDQVLVNNIFYKNRSWPDAGAYWTQGSYSPTCQLLFVRNVNPSDVTLINNNVCHEFPSEEVIWLDGRNGKVNADYTMAAYEAAYPLYAWGNISADPQFVDAEGDDFHLQPTSPCIDAGGPLTSTVSAGSGTVVPVVDSLFFTDGYGVVDPDVIRVGSEQVTVVSVDYAGDLLTVDRSISWSSAAPVCGDYQGAAPDMGVFEYGSAPPAAVVGRYVFYNNSAFDGDDPAANAADDGAIATDKTALLDGQVATFANYTSYSLGINGIMVDIDSLVGTPTAADFGFKVGNDNSPGAWSAGPDPTGITVRNGAGAGGSDRVTLIWADNAVTKQWLGVTVLATARTGLLNPDVFYFGNAVGETGNSPADADVTPSDEVAVRSNPRTLSFNPAAIDDRHDFNRDRKVGPSDQIICRNNGASGPAALQLIDLVPNQPPTVDAGADDSITWPTNSIGLDGTVSDDGRPAPSSVTTTWSKISGPGDVSFADPSAVDTNATFSAVGGYVLQLEADDGELSATDTVQITVNSGTPPDVFFADDFDDNNLNGWTVLAGAFETFQYLSEPGCEIRPTITNSRMVADLTDTNLSDIVYVSCEIRHTAGTQGSTSGPGWKQGRIWLVNDAGVGFSIYMALDQNGPGGLYIYTTTDFGQTETGAGEFSAPGDPNGNEKKTVELLYNRLTDQVECFYEGASKGIVGVSSSYRDFTKVVVYLKTPYLGDWGQLDMDDIRIADTPVGN